MFFTKIVFVSCYDFCSVSHSCRKLACISCCNLRFTNGINSSNSINLCPSFPLPCLLTTLPSYQPTLTKSSLLNRELDFFVVLSTNTSNSSLRKTKMCLFFPRLFDGIKLSEIMSLILIPTTHWYRCFNCY